MHLLHFLTGQRLQDVQLVVGDVKLGARLAGVVHRLGGLCQGVHKVHIINTEPFSQVSEHNGTIFFNFEVTGKILLVEGLVVYFNF